MKRITSLCASAILGLMLMPSLTSASHIAALDLSLTCLGGNYYKVRFVLYRDCSGIGAPATVNLTFVCTGNAALNFTLYQVNQLAGTGQTITASCPQMPSKCSGGSSFGVQEYVYQAYVTLPPCNYWRISWGTCCRNASNTIQGATSTSAYIEATLNNMDAPDNSTPMFIDKPVTILNVGQTTLHNQGAIDPDGDSLVYAMVTPFNSSNTTYVNWIPPSTATQPFSSNPPMTLDTATGLLTVTPTMNIISPMAIRVQEWRTINGVPVCIGSIYRDLQINAIASVNALPVLSGMDFTLANGYDPTDTIFDIDVCVEDTTEFYIHGFDADNFNVTSVGSPEKFSISWNNGIPQATFQIYNQATDSAYAHFTWKPQVYDLLTPNRCFTVTITDLACPYFGTNTYTYCLHLKGFGLDIGSDTLMCRGETMYLQAPSFPGSPQYIWTVNGMPEGPQLNDSSYLFKTKRKAPGIYTIKLEIGGINTGALCSMEDEFNVNLVYLPRPDLGNDTILTNSNPLTLNAGPGMLYLWNTGAMTQTISVNQTGGYTVLVDGGNGTRCTGTDYINVEFPVGVKEEQPEGNYSITPNPTTGLLTLNFSNAITEEISITLHNHAGQCVYQSTLPPDHHTSHMIHLDHLPSGVYLMNVDGRSQSFRQKVVLNKQ